MATAAFSVSGLSMSMSKSSGTSVLEASGKREENGQDELKNQRCEEVLNKDIFKVSVACNAHDRVGVGPSSQFPGSKVKACHNLPFMILSRESHYNPTDYPVFCRLFQGSVSRYKGLQSLSLHIYLLA